MKLDEYDLKLINILKDNSRLSISEIAKLLGLSRQTVKARIERLEREGVIQKYTIKLSPEFEKMGNLIILIVETENPEKFKEFEEIIEINKIASKRYLIKVVIGKLGELTRIMNEAGFEILEVIPVLEREERDRSFKVEVPFKCDYCGKETVDQPLIYKYRNKVFVFCCRTCLSEFKALSG